MSNVNLIVTSNKSEELVKNKKLPLDLKVMLTQSRIEDWYEHWNGHVYLSFSGGKDSTVLADIVWSIYPDVPAVFSNTGLEYPEIVQFVKKKLAEGRPIVIVRPERTFRDVVLKDGFPLVSKKVAEMVSRMQKPQTDRNANTRRLYMTGVRRDGVYVAGSKIPEKWKSLINAPFKITNTCCDALKKDPFKKYQKETGRMPITGVMGSEGGRRALMDTCNSFDGKAPQSRPMLFWDENDVWEYIRTRDIDYCEVYDDRVIDGRKVKGEKRTGCMFCAFGAHMEKDTTRFQRMAISHPKQWNYCINKLGMGKALDFIGVEYHPLPEEEQLELFYEADQKSA